MKNSFRSIASIVFTVAFLTLIVFPDPAMGQSSGRETSPRAPGPPRSPAPSRQPSIRERQMKMLEMEREAARPQVEPLSQLALLQIAEDFKKIQEVNNRLLSTAIPAATLDYAKLAATLREIKACADRLKANLALPIPEEAQPKSKRRNAQDVDGIKANLLSLDRYITSFISNPVFKNPDVVNVEQAKKAGRDLDTIIELAQFVIKDAERFMRLANTPR